MSDVRLPIQTTKNGEETTKVCVEDMYKAVNRVIDVYNDFVDFAEEQFDEIGERSVCLPENPEDEQTDDNTWIGCLVVGKGTSKPCHGDEYDEKIGCDIAFMKAKLNANLKKWNFFVKLWNKNVKLQNAIDEELAKIEGNILMDLDGVREYNPEYLKDIEYKLGIFDE